MVWCVWGIFYKSYLFHLLGALFLAIIVTVPNIRSSYGFGVTSLLILVGVTVDTSRQIQTLLISESYNKTN